MTNRKRLGALLLCVGLILVLFVSSAYIAHEAGHDCCGEDCPVCQMIAMNVHLLHLMGLAMLVWLTLLFLTQVSHADRMQSRLVLPLSGTLVSWKIRLND